MVEHRQLTVVIMGTSSLEIQLDTAKKNGSWSGNASSCLCKYGGAQTNHSCNNGYQLSGNTTRYC